MAGGLLVVLAFALGVWWIAGSQPSASGWPSGDRPVFEYNADVAVSSDSIERGEYRPSEFKYDKTSKEGNAADEYNDSLDYYQDDPEDELRFDPEVFDFQDE